MSKHFKYLRHITRHKWFVFCAGVKLKVPFWQLVFHDWHKFTPGEWFPYVNHFYGDGDKRKNTTYYDAANTGDPAFDYAWLAHQHRGKHHWQHWTLTLDDGTRQPGQRYWLEQAYSDMHESELAEYIDDEWQGKIETNVNINNPEGIRRIGRLLEDANRPAPKVLPMPEKYAREMVADWSGAGRALGHGNDVVPWYRKNKDKMQLHPDTRVLVEELVRDTSAWYPGNVTGTPV